VLAKAARVGRSTICEYERGNSIPAPEVAIRLAEALKNPSIATMSQQSRVGSCLRCRTVIVMQTRGRPRRYCSVTCERLYTAGRKRVRPAEAIEALNAEVRKLRRAIAVICIEDCPDGEGGVCRRPTCAGRCASPLPLATDRRVAVGARESKANHAVVGRKP
jgi:transcriptional regulator with XRE-family HTH domain